MNIDKVDEIAENVKDKTSFLLFMDALIKDYEINSKDWENKTIPEYLKALSACIDDMDGYYQYKNIEIPKDIPWHIFSDNLNAARVYE